MIDARGVALQGLWPAIRSDMVARQGLWPVVDTAGPGGRAYEPRERTDEDDVLAVVFALITSGILEQ